MITNDEEVGLYLIILYWIPGLTQKCETGTNVWGRFHIFLSKIKMNSTFHIIKLDVLWLVPSRVATAENVLHADMACF